MPSSQDRNPQRRTQQQPQKHQKPRCDRSHEGPWRCDAGDCYLPDPWLAFRDDLNRNRSIYGALLGTGGKAAPEPEVERFIMTCYQSAWHKPALLEANRDSLLLSFAEAAVVRLNLNPTAKECYIEVRKGVARFATQYQGLIVLMHRGSDIEYIYADVVRRGDDWRQVGGSEPRIEHVHASLEDAPDGYDSDESILAAYAVVKIRGSSRATHEVIRRADILKARAMSTGPAWNAWFSRMAMKVPLKRLANRLPGADQIRQIASVEDARSRGETVTLPQVQAAFGEQTPMPAAPRRGAALPKNSDDLRQLIQSSGPPSPGSGQDTERTTPSEGA